MPPAAIKSIYGKISKSQILTPPHPQGQVISVKCEQPFDELTVQVWLLYDHPNFKYCTLNVSGTELRTDRQTDGRTDGRTDDPNTRCPRRTFQAGGIKTCNQKVRHETCTRNSQESQCTCRSDDCLINLIESNYLAKIQINQILKSKIYDIQDSFSFRNKGPKVPHIVHLCVQCATFVDSRQERPTWFLDRPEKQKFGRGP